MLSLSNLTVSVESKTILQDISLDFQLGKTYFLLGKNGSGKSSLALTLMGHPRYRVEAGEIRIGSETLTHATPDVRANSGLFLALQHVPEIKGVRLAEYLRTIYNAHLEKQKPETKPLTPFVFLRFIKPILSELRIDERMLDRDLNVGFSGGEKRKIEILQMKLLAPKYIILDEIDSGLDVDAFATIATSLKQEQKQDTCRIVITHNFRMAEYLSPDEVIILQSGKVVRRGGKELIDEIGEKGFEA